jgi:calcineurin-like phosphoesterase family protein
MNAAIVERHNSIVTPDDDVYVLGDLCLGGGSDEALAANKELIESINGKLYIVRGNHDTPKRIKMYTECKNVFEDCGWATMLNYKKYHFYLSHYPTITANLDEKNLKQCIINLYGHTHQCTNFYNDSFLNYHVGVDSHNCYPVNVETILSNIKAKVNMTQL